MYPENQTIQIFGEEVSWPGLDPNTGKFTNGSFSDPMVKPSFIPAETVNLILDNLAGLISSLGGTPDNGNANQLRDAVVAALALKANNVGGDVNRVRNADTATRLAVTSRGSILTTWQFLCVVSDNFSGILSIDGASAATTATQTAVKLFIASSTNDLSFKTVSGVGILQQSIYLRRETLPDNRMIIWRVRNQPLTTGAARIAVDMIGQGSVDFANPVGPAPVGEVVDIPILNTLIPVAPIASPGFTGSPNIGGNHLAVVANTSNSGSVDLPIGTYILVADVESTHFRNLTIIPRLSSANSSIYVVQGAGAALDGTWRSCGRATSNPAGNTFLARRVA